MKKIQKVMLLGLGTSCLWLFSTTHFWQHSLLSSAQLLGKTTHQKTLKIMFVGDIMSQISQIKAAQTSPNAYDYTPSFQYIAPIIKTADVAIGNIECTLTPRPPYTGYPLFRSPTALASALKNSGFDVLTTANNHALDGGREGLKYTIDALQAQHILHTGTFKDSQSYRRDYPLVFYKNGFKIALLSYTQHTNGLQTPDGTIVNRLIPQQIAQDLAKAKTQNPDFTIAFLHWGEEHMLNEDRQQRYLAQWLHQSGIDLVIGAHPHVVQPIRRDKNNHLTAYSLGNFISAQPFAHTEGGLIFEIDLEKTNDGTHISDSRYIPVFRYAPIEAGKRRYYALPVSPFEDLSGQGYIGMAPQAQTQMRQFADRVRAQMQPSGVQEHRFQLGDLPQPHIPH